MKSWIAGAMLLLLGVIRAAYPQVVTSDVLQATVVLQGVIQFGEDTTNQSIHSMQILSADLVNLALGRELGTALQSNEVLAYGTSPATNNAKVFVYDSNTSSNLATVGEIDPILEAAQSGPSRRKTEVIAQMNVPRAGSISNGLLGGNIVLDGRSVLDTNDSVMKFSAKMLGSLDTIFVTSITNLTTTNYIVTTNNKIETNSVIITNVLIGPTVFPVVIRKATMTTGSRKIGTLVEGP